MAWLLRRLFGLVFKVAAAAALVWVLREVARRWIDGPEASTVSGAWREPDAGGSAGRSTAPPVKAPAADGAPVTERAPATKKSAPKKAPATKKASGAAKRPAGPGPEGPAAARPGAWLPPNGSAEAPSSHPVKAKVASRVYRVPGMSGYERMVADRCYPTTEAAESDGFTRATR